MDSTKATGKTIGEMEKLTGIPRRELKYFIEQGIMRPSLRTQSGYWAYSGEDIQKAQLAALCRRLDFPVKTICAVLADPDRWKRELEMQIVRLRDRQDRTIVQLQLADRLRGSGVWEALQLYCDSLT